jgi:uncharacterized glyoxalase superfamily protein PhnB
MTDPFDALSSPVEPQTPRPAFARALRDRLVDELGLDPIDTYPTIDLPQRSRTMSTTTPPAARPPVVRGTPEGHTVTSADRPGTGGGIWAAAFYTDALAGIRLLVDVFGFEEQIVVVGDDGVTVHHSQLRWPEGGIVQIGTYLPDNPHSRPPGMQGLYVVTADPWSVWERCHAAGLEVMQEPYTPDYDDPAGMGFTVRDREGNIWSFGTYGLGTT